MPLPEAYAACAEAAPPPPYSSNLSASCGLPSTKTGSVNATVMLTGAFAPCVASSFGEVTETTLGAAVSILMSAEPDSEPGEPGGGSARLAAPPSAPAMLPVRAVAL